jgi:hypothetical protein
VFDGLIMMRKACEKFAWIAKNLSIPEIRDPGAACFRIFSGQIQREVSILAMANRHPPIAPIKRNGKIGDDLVRAEPATSLQ